jgi:hypothetical protein
MPFSASTCIINTGNTSLSSSISVYSNIDSFTSSFTTIPLTAITGNECPYIITNIPDGTTILRLKDLVSTCCYDFPIQSNDLCVTCDLDFNIFSSSTVSLIVAGDLTGSCSNVTDYVVYWYGPDSTTEIGYISGKGTEFSYDFTHPLTGSSAIFAEAGTYKPVIDKLILSGLTFSQTGGTGNYLANLDCFPSVEVIVDPLNCSNGTAVGDYSHVFSFSSATSGTPPVALNTSFVLSANTNFFAYKFRGFNIDDTLVMTLNSVNYPVEIGLENIQVGLTAPTRNFTSFPRSYNATDNWGRVLCLTGFTISNGDTINISLIPNTANTQTNWSLSLECLETWDCNSCLDTSVTNPNLIFSASASATSVTCSGSQITYEVSGCTTGEVTSTDAWKYLYNINGGNSNPASLDRVFSSSGVISITTSDLRFANISCGIGATTAGICSAPNGQTITYEKSIVSGIGNIDLTFSSFSDLTFFYSDYNTLLSTSSGSTDSNDVDYYRSFGLRIPNPLGSTNCGDGTTTRTLRFHPTSIVTTGGTGPWTMSITMPTISATKTFITCESGCDGFMKAIVNNINADSTGTSTNFSGTSTTGSKYTIPFAINQNLSYNVTTPTASTIQAKSVILDDYLYTTVPWSGVSNTLIPNLSGETCIPFNQCPALTGFICQRFYYQHQVRLVNPLDVLDYEIWASPINNLQYSGSPGTAIYELALQYSGGSVTYANPTYCI